MADFEGTPINDAIIGTADADTINGYAGMDTLVGMAGNDIINGGDDADSLFGGDGDDLLHGGTGNDYLTGGAGLDTQFGDEGDDYFFIENRTEMVTGEIYDGGSGTDTLGIYSDISNFYQPLVLTGFALTGIERIAASNNFIHLTAAQLVALSYVSGNFLIATGGSVALAGKEFNGGIYVSDNGITLDLSGSIGYISAVFGGAGNDAITGRAVDVYLFGYGGNDTLIGGAGNDTIKGGSGLDVMQGGDGNDTFLIGGANDTSTGETFDGGAGYDIIHIDPDISDLGPYDLTASTLTSIEGITQNYNSYGGVILNASQINALQEIHGPIHVRGTGSVSLAGINADNSVYSLADTVTGFSTAGMIGNFAGLYAGDNDNILTGSSGFDYFDAGGGNDTIDGGGGDDQLLGKAGNDSITGGAGNDQLSGGDGTDQLYGGDGDDVLTIASFLSTTGEVYDGGAGYDRLDMNGASLDLSQQTIINIEWLDAGPYNTVTATITQLSGFETLAGHFALAGAGSFLLAGKTLYNFQLDTSAAGNTVDLTGATTGYVNVYGGIGADTITGGTGNDFLQGGGGADTLNGADGGDTLSGGAGLDTLSGGAGDDIFIVQNASDIVAGESYTGGDGSDVFKSYHVGDFDISGITLTGIERIDLSYSITLTLTSAQLDSFSDIGLGHFKLSNAGSVSMSGVAGNGAFFTLSNFGNTLDLRGFLQSGTTVNGGGADDTIWGSVGGDILNGGGGTDWLAGGDGNDTLNGGTGTDTFYGGAGNDTFVLDASAELVFENAGEGTDIVITSTSHYLYANVENLTLTGGAGNFGVGNELANVLTGNTGANLLIAGAGDDTVNGGAGNDVLFGQDGADTLGGDAGIDYIAAGAGNDTIDGGANPDEIYGEGGDDTITGGTSFDYDKIVGGDGNDTIYGNSGQGDYDHLYGNLGNDTFYVDTPADLVFEQPGEGTDTVYAGINGGGFYLYDNIENLILTGNTPFGVGNGLDNSLTGNAIGNYLLGGLGNDILNGMGGNDVLFGEGGNDTFVFTAGTGGDVIGDFTRGQDKIDISAFGFSFAQAQANFIQNGNVGALNLGNGDFIVLHNVTMSTLAATDFIFG